jgi:putative phosphoribosyl transferase
MAAMQHFHDRTDAGRRLAIEVGRRFGIPSVVAAVSAGGGLVGLSLARAFARPLVFAYCAPLHVPWDDEATGEFGAVDGDGQSVLDYASLAATRIGQLEIVEARALALREVRRFHEPGWFPALDDALPAPRVLLVDDGLDDGWRMEAAVAMARRRRVSRVLVAAPCASRGAAAWFEANADGFVALAVDDEPTAAHYDDFARVTRAFLGPRVPRLRPRAGAEAVR